MESAHIAKPTLPVTCSRPTQAAAPRCRMRRRRRDSASTAKRQAEAMPKRQALKASGSAKARPFLRTIQLYPQMTGMSAKPATGVAREGGRIRYEEDRGGGQGRTR